ncbi:MAG TPA: hypothetical protein VMS64_34530, partial [Candidatus Methylomirabilis sp.]|nr:hypothetical protein [Candidatus Methylomirabilis sp.]
MKLHALSYAYPPWNSPRSIQVSRLLRHVNLPTIVYCGRHLLGSDRSLAAVSRADGPGLLAIHRWRRSIWEPVTDRVTYVVRRELLQLPDRYRRWSFRAAQRIRAGKTCDPSQDVLITFGHPMSSHLAGVRLKESTGIRWIAHFSDPWVDNPFSSLGASMRNAVASMEREVMAATDRIIFTNHETLELVMSKYPAEWRGKARVLPHCFEARRVSERKVLGPRRPLVIRYVGKFYGKRTPEPLFRALVHLQDSDPRLLEGVTFELVGELTSRVLSSCPSSKALTRSSVKLRGRVTYGQSLSLMDEADGLLVIDAPFEASPFLPSKLVDYLGARKPIVGLTPSGASARLIEQLGG